jgi:pimeloyl-ACP methyl ester carboxylesterase
VKRLQVFLTSTLPIMTVLLALMIGGCANIKNASKSSTSLFSFLGFSELPDWYIRNKYSFPDSKWITNDFGTMIHYRDVGEGPVVVLVHGEMGSMHIWNDWISTLSQNFRVIAIDLPGSGLTSAPHCVSNPEETCPENLSSNYLSHTLEYFIEDLNISKFTLVGSSYSGYLAAQYAAHQHPEKLNKLILITPMGFQQEVPWILNYVTVPGMDVFNRYIQPSTVATSILEHFYGDAKKITPSNRQRFMHLSQSKGAHHSNVIQLSMVRTLMEQGMLIDLSDISIPTLVMWGESDTWGDFSHAERWEKELGNATLVTYPAYGHILMEEGATITATDVVSFMNDEPIPSLDSLGLGGGFSIDDVASEFDKDALFGTPESFKETELFEETELLDAE